MEADHQEVALLVTKERPRASWARTLAVQAVLCLAFYAAFQIGTPQQPPRPGGGADRLRREPTDLYFISVRGGARVPEEQAQLLQQMEMVAKFHEVKFVVNIAELGEDDLLLQNATLHFPVEIPWYSTTVSRGQRVGKFWKRIKLPLEKVLDIVAIDTGSLQGLMHDQQLEGIERNISSHLSWIHETLSVADGDWHIVVGFDPLIVCEATEETETVKFNKPLHHMFIHYGVDAYLSKQGCGGYFYRRGGIAYVGNPGQTDMLSRGFSTNVNPDDVSQMRNGFLLHRISPLEMESNFIDSRGKIVFKTVIHQRGREVI